MQRFNLLGVNVDLITEDEVYERILKISETGKPAQVILLDTILLVKAKFNRELLNTINASDLVIPISRGVKIGLAFFKEKIYIYNPFYFTIRLLSHFTDFKKIVYILGGNKKMIDKAEQNLKESFPGIRLMGKYHIEYKKDFEPKLITVIQKISPALVLVSMRRPKQEKWIFHKKNHFQNGVFIGVENFIDTLGSKLLPPSDKMFHSLGHKIKRFLCKPIRVIDYFFYFTFLLTYKIFNIK